MLSSSSAAPTLKPCMLTIYEPRKDYAAMRTFLGRDAYDWLAALLVGSLALAIAAMLR